MSQSLRLIALDHEDLAVVSTHIQDAVHKVRDMAYLPKTKRFALVAARFDWLSTSCGKPERCATGLHFERVLKATTTGFDQADADRCLNLLDIRFSSLDAPAGQVILTFSGGAAVKLDVECLETQMHDLGPRWPAKATPGHCLDETPEEPDLPKSA
jgi:hypothetical protein